MIPAKFLISPSLVNSRLYLAISSRIALVGFNIRVKEVPSALVAIEPFRPLLPRIPIIALASSRLIPKAFAVGPMNFIASAN